jgi:hypothetical protein
MKIRIKETGESKELRLIDPKSGANWVRDYIGVSDDFVPSEETAEYTCTLEAYETWIRDIAERQKIADKRQDLATGGEVRLSNGLIASSLVAKEYQKEWDEEDPGRAIDFDAADFWFLPFGEGSPEPLTDDGVADLIESDV